MFKVDASVIGDKITKTQELLAHIPNAAPKTIARALNRTIVGVRTDVVKTIAEIYFVKQGDVRETLTIENAKPGSLQALLMSSGSVPGIQHFKINPKAVTKVRPAVGIRVQVRRDSKPTRIPGTFIAGSLVGVFRRTGDQRTPLERIPGPAVPSMMREAIENAGVEARTAERLIKELNHEVDFLLTKGAK